MFLSGCHVVAIKKESAKKRTQMQTARQAQLSDLNSKLMHKLSGEGKDSNRGS